MYSQSKTDNISGEVSTEEFKAIESLLKLVEDLNHAASLIAANTYAAYTPEVNLAESIKDAIFLLDSSKDYRDSLYVNYKAGYANRPVKGKLQRLEAMEEKLDALFAALESL